MHNHCCGFAPTKGLSITAWKSKSLKNLQCKRPLRPTRQPNTRLNLVASIAERPRVVGGGVAPSAEDFDFYDGADPLKFSRLAKGEGVRMVPMWRKLFSDQLTPVVAYRCLVKEGDDEVPSFLLESVYTGERVGRYSLIGARPVTEIVAYANDVTVTRHRREGPVSETTHCDDPWDLARQLSEDLTPAIPPSLPGGKSLFSGGWVGYGGYDTMRYNEPGKLPFESAPKDDLGLPDLHLGLYRDVIVFDQVAKVIYVVHWADLQEHDTDDREIAAVRAHAAGCRRLSEIAEVISKGQPLSTIPAGSVTINTDAATGQRNTSNMTRQEFMEAIAKAKYHIGIGDAFQIVFSQRFERWSSADPFSVYRSLRIINPSPYMIYMQCKGCSLVASSPEILTRVDGGILTNRPLAGTRRRGLTEEEDAELEKELLADKKDRSEHIMLVDLGRNDVGIVAEYGTVKPEEIMKVEKYSHVMHISSTITGKMRKGLTSWDALRATLPAGTISGAPKIRAMQIIDDLEPTKRGPYGGAIGYVSLLDHMNMALALRTMVVPNKPKVNADGSKEWQYMLQAGAGIVFESDPDAEYTETVNKAMAMSRAIDLAETAF